MCWMAGRRGDDALARAVRDVTNHEQMRGGHSWGYAALIDGEWEVEHGLGYVPAAIQLPEAEVAIAHTRFATRGAVTTENAHPFPVEVDGETVAYLCHNGTWLDAPDDGVHADSYFIARELENELADRPDAQFGDVLRSVGRRIGETLLVLHRSGALFTFAGRYTITADDGVIRSSGCSELTPDYLYVMGPEEAPEEGATAPADEAGPEAEG